MSVFDAEIKFENCKNLVSVPFKRLNNFMQFFNFKFSFVACYDKMNCHLSSVICLNYSIVELSRYEQYFLFQLVSCWSLLVNLTGLHFIHNNLDNFY